METKSLTPEQSIMAAASVGLSAATALYRLPPAKGSRPGLPAGKQSWPLGCKRSLKEEEYGEPGVELNLQFRKMKDDYMKCRIFLGGTVLA
ncbi:hypothetical protein llap_2260 [Limosa lapponica baueri]|uniref:Uncharacterized protein n=1 Tax=Limosa lapponica baueri TaxID=1758121 RepID=A0A2I0UN34_LIMLA|nr:hypothetical protein llap_2260 [Limosa lapponica baueri]